MSSGRALAEELGLTRVKFVKADVRSYAFESHGPFDVVLFLGLLYHLDAASLFEVTRRAADSTRRAMIVETHFAPCADDVVQDGGESYRGWTYLEHRPDDATATRQGRLLASLTNESSFWLDRDSLLSLLRHVGFPTVLECHVPIQPFQGADRLTLLALKSATPPVFSFPWIDRASEAEVRRRARPKAPLLSMPPCCNAKEEALVDVVIALGGWVRSHPEFVLGTREPVAIWRRADLESCTGTLRRVPPLLAVEVAGNADPEDEMRERARLHLEGGAGGVWLLLPEAGAVEVVLPSGSRRFSGDALLPAPPGLPSLAQRVGEILRPRPAAKED